MSSSSTTSADMAPAHVGPPDPIATLIDQLSAAADTGAAMTLGGRARVKVRRMPAGFAIGRGGRR